MFIFLKASQIVKKNRGQLLNDCFIFIIWHEEIFCFQTACLIRQRLYQLMYR